MKRYEDSYDCGYEKKKQKDWKQEHRGGGFRCSHCRQFVVINDVMGTANRNHCNQCLWSKHVDEAEGDRRAICGGGMEPIGLTLKHEGYGRTGEIMLIHCCSVCQKISINRIARDDMESRIIEVLEESLAASTDMCRNLTGQNIRPLGTAHRTAVSTQLFGTAL